MENPQYEETVVLFAVDTKVKLMKIQVQFEVNFVEMTVFKIFQSVGEKDITLKTTKTESYFCLCFISRNIYFWNLSTKMLSGSACSYSHILTILLEEIVEYLLPIKYNFTKVIDQIDI